MKITLELSAEEFALGALGAARLGLRSFGAAVEELALLSGPDGRNALLDMVTAMARERGVPPPPLREVAEAIAPVIREELEKMKSERLS